MRRKTGCFDCPLRKDYPKALLFERSKKNYELKRQLFTGLKTCVMVPVSNWLGDITKESFMEKYPVNVIHNGIDLNVFKPVESDLRSRLGIEKEKMVVLGVASPWVTRKGYDDMIRISRNEDIQVVMVGVTAQQKASLPSCIISVKRTQNQRELAEYYSAADVFVNPTYSDNFPTTNLEALACGTPVITYRTGGSPEAVDELTGAVVDQGNLEAMCNKILEFKNTGFKQLHSSDCRKRAEECFDKDKCFEKYIMLYEGLLRTSI